MEPPTGLWSSLWNFIRFLPFFIGLLILGFIKGIIMFPAIFLIVAIGISGIILCLWPLHILYTYYCILSTSKFGPALKFILSMFFTAVIISWPLIGIACGVLGGAAYGLLAPMFATFQAVDEGKTDKFYHCICDGTWDSVKGGFTIIRDFLDVCFHSYFSIMDDLRHQGPPEKYYEIRLLYVPQALIAGILGSMIDLPVISIIAMFKSFYMLFKGWHRLFHDCIGREGPFLETICVPFAGLAILLWPLAVVGAVLGSMVSSIFLGAYAAVVVYQECSFWFGLRYIVASLSIYDEYSNDVLDMPEGSCLPRLTYRKKVSSSQTTSPSTSFSRPSSFKNPLSRTNSLSAPLLELKPLELADALFKECQFRGEAMASEGIITLTDIEEAKSNKDSGRVISVGLPAYCLLQALLRSAKANSTGILLRDNVTEITSSNRPKDTVFDWFLNPLLIIKDQIIADKLSEMEEEYLGKLVLLNSDPARLKDLTTGQMPAFEIRRAELDALARRLQGITKSISRYPTFRRRFDSSMKNILEELAKKNGDSRKSSSTGGETLPRSKSVFGRMFSQKSFKSRTNDHGSDQDAQAEFEDLEIK